MLKSIIISFLLFTVGIFTGCQTEHSARTVAFSRLTADYWQIWTMQQDGGTPKQLTNSQSDKRYPAWSYGGREIMCRDNNGRTYLVDINTGKEKRILTSFGQIGSAAPSPKGSELLFVRFRTEIIDSSDLWLTSSPEGKNQKILTRDVGLQYAPAWSPDGKKIAYISGHGYQTHELFIMESDGKNRKQLTTNKALELLPAFSPDGRKIAYVSDITDNYEIWVMNTDGSDPTQLTNSEGIDTRPSWSPDGNHIMFTSNRSGNLQLWIMNSDGGNPTQLTRGADSMDPAWRSESLQ